MFAVVKIKENEKRIIPRIKYFFKKPLPVLERVNVSTGEPYYCLEIYKEQCGESLEHIRELLGYAADNIIFRDGFIPPESCAVRAYNPVKFRQLLLMNSTLRLLDSRAMQKENLRLCLIDGEGEYSSYTEQLVKSASSVSVCTNNASLYKSVCDYVYKKWGASVIMSDKLPELHSFDVIISPAFTHNKLYGNCTIIGNADLKSYEIFKGSKLSVPDRLKQIIPNGVSSLDFAAALYEHCHLKELGECRFADFMCVKIIR